MCCMQLTPKYLPLSMSLFVISQSQGHLPSIFLHSQSGFFFPLILTLSLCLFSCLFSSPTPICFPWHSLSPTARLTPEQVVWACNAFHTLHQPLRPRPKPRFHAGTPPTGSAANRKAPWLERGTPLVGRAVVRDGAVPVLGHRLEQWVVVKVTGS